MPQKESEAVLGGNGPIFMLGDITLRESRQVMAEMRGEIIRELKEDSRSMNQHVADLDHGARQPRLAIKADGAADNKTGERTEDTAKAVQAVHGDRFSANRVQAGPKTISTSFGVKIEPPALSCKDDVLIENGAAAPRLCLSLLEMRTTTAAGGLFPAG